MTIFTLTGVGVPIAFGSTQYFTAKQNVGQVKSFVDDLVMKLGTVSMRVALVLRSAEVQPVFQDLYVWLPVTWSAKRQFSPPLPSPLGLVRLPPKTEGIGVQLHQLFFTDFTGTSEWGSVDLGGEAGAYM